jgi:hypothetical protein
MKKKINILLIVAVIISCLFTGAAAAKKIDGYVYDNEGNPITSESVKIMGPNVDSDKGIGTTDKDGHYEVEVGDSGEEGLYELRVGSLGKLEEKHITKNDWHKEKWYLWDSERSYDFNHGNPKVGIPEFPTVAMPLAVVIGLVFLFNRRKGK